MSKPGLIEFIKSIIAAHNIDKKAGSLERAAFPDPIIVGFIFAILCIIAITFILIS